MDVYTYDKILVNGHLTLFKNNERNRNLYKKGQEILNYKNIFSNPSTVSFDEWFVNETKIGGINEIALESKLKIYESDEFDDIDIRYLKFFPIRFNGVGKNIFYEYCKGKIYRCYYQNKVIKKEEKLYVHFQKRDIAGYNTLQNKNHFLVIPNRFTDVNSSFFNIKKFLPDKIIRIKYLKIWFKRKVGAFRFYKNKWRPAMKSQP